MTSKSVPKDTPKNTEKPASPRNPKNTNLTAIYYTLGMSTLPENHHFRNQTSIKKLAPKKNLEKTLKNALWDANVPKRVPKVIPNGVQKAAHEPLFACPFASLPALGPKGLPKSPKWLPRAPKRAPGIPKRCPKGATSDPQECPNDFKR